MKKKFLIIFAICLTITALIAWALSSPKTTSNPISVSPAPSPLPTINYSQSSITSSKPESYLFSKVDSTSQFRILVLGTPFESARKEAEKEFLKTQNLTQTQACAMNVVVGTVQFANPNEAGKDYPLSFCTK